VTLLSIQEYGVGQTAAEYINGAFNGQKGFKDHENCDTCGEERAEKKCSECKSADYCDQVCQKYHWFLHKKHCERLKAEQIRREEYNKKVADANEKKEKTETKELEATVAEKGEVAEKDEVAEKENRNLPSEPTTDEN